MHLTAVFGVNFWKNTEGGKKSENTVRVLTYNAADFVMPYHKDKLAARNGLNKFFKEQNPEIICLQEGGDLNDYTMKHVAAFFPFLSAYPYQSRQIGNQIVIYSRFPIVGEGKLDSEKYGNGCNFADVQIGTKKVRVFSLHLTSNRVSGMANDLAKSGKIGDDDSWLEFARMLKLVRSTGIKRTREAESIASNIQQSPYPVIVCGDFNEIPVSYVYKTLSNNLSDAFREAAFGFSSTYNGKIPALKIDNILMSPNIEARNCKIHSLKYSDHYPITADLIF
ncbi:MAG: endonuclease/exonuclease/phosphatase family protein [Saprospiraceae bacterium]|nr:endonuclease/exonuclease/phosphatase family protein [Saprospiraceae bacterium]